MKNSETQKSSPPICYVQGREESPLRSTTENWNSPTQAGGALQRALAATSFLKKLAASATGLTNQSIAALNSIGTDTPEFQGSGNVYRFDTGLRDIYGGWQQTREKDIVWDPLIMRKRPSRRFPKTIEDSEAWWERKPGDRGRIQLEFPAVPDAQSASNTDSKRPSVVQYGGAGLVKVHDWSVSNRRFALDPHHHPPQGLLQTADSSSVRFSDSSQASPMWEANHGQGPSASPLGADYPGQAVFAPKSATPGKIDSETGRGREDNMRTILLVCWNK